MAAGGVIAYPTEAVWGLGCDPLNTRALARLLTIKQRSPQKGLIVVAADVQQLQPFIANLAEHQIQKLVSANSAPTSWIVPTAPGLPALLTGGRQTICVRVSTHPGVIELCQAWSGAIVSTSANPAGRPPARSAVKTRAYFGASVDHYFAGALGESDKPSQIKDLLTDATIRAA